MIRWRLQELLAARGWTGYKLAGETGLTVPATYRLLRGGPVGRIDAKTLEAMCTAFDVEPGDLLECVPDKTTKRKR